MKNLASFGYGLTLEKEDSKYYLVLYGDRDSAILLINDHWLNWAEAEHEAHQMNLDERWKRWFVYP
jgi:hypothetical protein